MLEFFEFHSYVFYGGYLDQFEISILNNNMNPFNKILNVYNTSIINEYIVFTFNEGFLWLSNFFTNWYFFNRLTIYIIRFLYLVVLTTTLFIFIDFIEIIYNFVLKLFKQLLNINSYKFFSILLSFFISIFLFNILGMVIYGFSTTSQIITTLLFSFYLYTNIIIISIILQKGRFFDKFIPAGAPLFLKPILVVIEFISYFSRPFSLGIRLFANLMAGHTLLVILASFIYPVNFYSNISFISLVLMIIGPIFCLEVMIALLQAFVFILLICVFLNESYNFENSH